MSATPSEKVTPFLMFAGQAEEAMTFYTGLVPNSDIVSITRYGAEGPGTEGSVEHATFTLGGRTFMAIDSNIEHDFGFTPALSMYLTCESEVEIERLYAALVDGGEPLMPLDAYGFSSRFGWVNDRFGVSWQLNLASVE